MAKGTGLIGNFKGKVGNMVGYNLKDSNNKQTQGIRVYQPVVRNPKSYAQAQQRCIMKPINDFYRALKPVISRGQEGKAYGNASRLAWLKNVMKDFNGPWLVKGTTRLYDVPCFLTSGSLASVNYSLNVGGVVVIDGVIPAEATVNTIAGLSAALKAMYPGIQDGDQITIVATLFNDEYQLVDINSFVVSSTNTDAISGFQIVENHLTFRSSLVDLGEVTGSAVIVSREGNDGQHLRSNAKLVITEAAEESAPYIESSKASAIASYMAAGANTDWPQEALEG